MKGFFLFGNKFKLFREWSKLIGLTRAVKLFLSAGTLLFWVFVLSGVVFCAILPGCQGLTFDDETKGELKLIFTQESMTKAVVREFPDSNSFILSIKSSSGGTTIYSGKYGERPANLQMAAGSYDINIYSRLFITPEFDAVCYSDSKTVVIQSGKVYLLSLICRQSNVGLRLSFTPEFMSRFVSYKPEILDTKGSILYPYVETRFAYLNPGNVSVRLKEVLPEGSSGTPEVIPILDRVVTARDMLTINLHANPDDASASKSGIVIDTTSNWVFEYIVIGGGGDGMTKESAFKVDQLVQNVGAKDVWITGYIVGGDLTASGINFEAPFGSATNIAIADSPTVRDRAKCASVALPSGTLRDLLNLSSTPSNHGKRVYLKGTVVAAYFGLTGVNPLTGAQF
ncbi:MAG: DUF6359 domain-containing protein [Rikenellaceae bacterium]